MSGRWRAAVIAVLMVSLDAATATAQVPRTVSGTVRSAADSMPLAGVRVSVVERTARGETDRDGRFVLTGLPAIPLTLVFDRLGVARDTMALPPTVDEITVYLEPQPVMVRPLVAEGALPARERFEQVAQPSTVTIGQAELRAAPALIEADVARTVQLLPGLVAKNDFSVGLNVRGGESDQNLIRLDGTTVFNPFHLGGLFGTFDPSAVSRVDLITGGFPAGFGGRLSSVLDVELRQGSRSETTVSGAVSVLSAKALVDGPIGNTGVTYLVGARRTYADAFIGTFSDDEVFTYYFADAVAKLTVPIGAGALRASGYWGRDASVFEWIAPEPGRDGADLGFHWGNGLAGLTFTYPFGRMELEQHLSVSAFSTGLRLEPEVLDIDNRVVQLAARTSLTLPVGLDHDFQVGVGVERHHMDYGFESVALETAILDLRYRPTVWSAFVDDQWQPAPWLLLRPGVRLEHVSGGAGFTGVSPRVGFKTFLSRDFALTGSAGRYYQAVHSIRDQEVPLTLFDFWIGADDLTPVARSDHLVLGFERWFGPAMSLSVEGFLKSFDNLVIRNRADDPRVRGDGFLVGTGYARGVDLLLRKHEGRIKGWIGYGLAKTERSVGAETFPPAHDRRHTVNVVIEAPGPLGSDLGIRWGYGSPIPYTGITGQWLHRQYNAELHLFEDPEEEVLGGPTNAERFPHYSRLDIGFRWRFEGWGGVWRPYLQFVNLYNRRNVFIYTFDYTTVPATRSGYSQLPLLPTIGLEFEW